MNIQKTMKNCSHANTILNVFACGGSLLIFGLNPVPLLLSFIGSDILFMGLDNIVQNYIIKKSLLNKEDLIELQEFLKESMEDSKYSDEENYERYQKMFEKVNMEVTKEIEKEQKEIEELKKQEEILEKKETRNFDSSLDALTFFNEKYQTLNNSDKKTLKNIKNLCDDISELIKQNPKASSKIGSIFNLYVDDIFEILQTLNDMSEDKKLDYLESFENLIEQFTEYLTKLKDKIINYDTNIDVTINALTKKLKQETKKIEEN